MKRFLPVLLAVLIFASCQKELTSDNTGTTTGTTTNTGGSFTAKIDGTPWVASKGAQATFATTGFGLPRILNITGLGNDKRTLTITMFDSGKHVYTLLPTNALNAAAYIDSNMANPANFSSNQAWLSSQPGGMVTVTKIDSVKNTISGTFSFNVYRRMDSLTRSFTEGVFTDIPFTTGSGFNPPSANDTFRVKINGTAFDSYSISGILLAANNSITVQSANQAANKNVSVTFPLTSTPGNYVLDFFGGTYIGAYLDGSSSYASSSGTLQILEHNTSTKRVRGNFNFVGTQFTSTGTALLTEGYFSVKYQ
jgi:hypothetical protein